MLAYVSALFTHMSRLPFCLQIVVPLPFYHHGWRQWTSSQLLAATFSFTPPTAIQTRYSFMMKSLMCQA